jgi:transposase
MPTPAGRRRVSVLAALNAITHDLVTVVTETYINSDSVCLLLHKLAALKLTVPITVVLDNARYQRCQRVQECAATLGIELLFLPPYSPHLNLIERVWKFVKKQCLYTKYYPTFEAFKGAILRVLETANVEHKKALDSLLSLKFQSFRKVNVLIT